MRQSGWGTHAAVALGYLAATLFVTWPLPAHLATSLPHDYGDPVFVAWVMAWVARHVTAALTGNAAAWAAMWEAPIFAPEHATLTYSEHFLGQTVPLLPVYWVTHNPLLLYNLAFLMSFVGAGLAAHGLARRLTDSHWAGAVAGATFAFSGYRMLHSLPHLHTLSIQWWVFGLWALDVYAETGRRRPLLVATLALVLQNLSSSYFMAFTPPFTAMFAVWALWRHGRLAERRAWVALGVCGVASVALVLPIVVRYLALSTSLGVARSLEDVQLLSVQWISFVFASSWLTPVAILALAGAVALYEGAKVNVNHPKGNPLAARDYQDRLGVVRAVVCREGLGLFGDLHFNPKHALAGQLQS